MKPFQFFKIDSLVDLSVKRDTTVQLNFLEGSTREPTLRFVPLNTLIAGRYQKIEIYHEIPTKKVGITTFIYDGVPQEIEFNKFLTPEKFNAYYDEKENVILFCASKDTCKSAFKQLNRCFNFNLESIDFDFAKATDHIDNYMGAWFKGLSSELRAAALFGTSVEDNEHFKDFCVSGMISNAIIPFFNGGRMHQIMITKRSSVVLVDHYNNNDEVELKLLSDIYQEVIKPTWSN